MRDLLPRIRTRVDRLVAGVECDCPHVLTTVSFVQGGDPVPDGPPADAATCGTELEHHHIIHVRDEHVA